jgi:hypothetical protein
LPASGQRRNCGIGIELEPVEPLVDAPFVFEVVVLPAPQAGLNRGSNGRIRKFRNLRQVRDSEAVAASDLSPIGRELARDDPEQRRLSGAVRADEADAVSVRERERDAAEQRAPAEGVTEVANRELNGHAPA